jgi:hypothetical protein
MEPIARCDDAESVEEGSEAERSRMALSAKCQRSRVAARSLLSDIVWVYVWVHRKEQKISTVAAKKKKNCIGCRESKRRSESRACSVEQRPNAPPRGKTKAREPQALMTKSPEKKFKNILTRCRGLMILKNKKMKIRPARTRKEK